MSLRVRVWFVVCCTLTVNSLSSAAEASGDEQLLRAAGLADDGPSLLAFFRRQIADEITLRRARVSIEQLGSDSFRVRERASHELTTLGSAILPLLQRTIRETSDLEVRRRARAAAEVLQARCPAAVVAAAARLLAQRSPFGAAEALLACLPDPYDDSVTEAIQDALTDLVRGNGAALSVCAGALASPVSSQRIAAAVALCRLDSVVYWPQLRKLLHDDETLVRVRVAEELAAAGDQKAVPVLIDLLAQLPLAQAGTIEELLFRLAGVASPQAPLGSEPDARIKCRDAWRAWWRVNGVRADMTVLKDRQRPLGYTLLVLLNDNRVVERDRAGKLRWQIDGLGSPLDAQVLPGGRVLIAEYETKRVTERTLRGEILWEKKLTEPPIHVQRLPDGSTFIATRRQLLEVDRSGQRGLVRYRSNDNGIITACRYRDGRIGCIEKSMYFELDALGKERKRFAVVAGVFTTNSLTPLTNGHLLVASYGGGVVQEYDRTGQIVWRIQMGRPLCAVRLASGNTLVSSQDMVLVEYDRAGKEVSRHAAPGHPCQIRRR